DGGRTPASDPLEAEPSAGLPSRTSSTDVVLLAGGVILFVMMLFSMSRAAMDVPFLSPLLIALAGAALLWPIRHSSGARGLFMPLLLVLGLCTLDVLSGVLAPFVAMSLLAFLLDPLVTSARERYNIP